MMNRFTCTKFLTRYPIREWGIGMSVLTVALLLFWPAQGVAAPTLMEVFALAKEHNAETRRQRQLYYADQQRIPQAR